MKWRVPLYRTGVLPSPFGGLVAAQDGTFVADKEDVDEWFRSIGAQPVTTSAGARDVPLRAVMKEDKPEASYKTAGQLVFVRDERGGRLYGDMAESLIPLTPPLDIDQPWGPRMLEGLQEGWIADDLVGANASAVRGWIGLKGMTLIQASAAKRPLLYTTDASHCINGRQTVYFDGTDDTLNLTGLVDPFNKPMQSVIAVIRPNAPMNTTEGVLWCSTDDGGPNTWCWGGYDAGGAAQAHVYHQRNNGDTEDVLTGPQMTTAPTIVEWTSDGAQTQLRLKHAVQTLAVTNGANNGHGFKESTSRDNFTLGCRLMGGNESRNWRGDVAMLLVLTHITMEERAKLFSYIAANYALGL